MGKQQHNWVTFYNPRNGRVRIRACSACGIAKGMELAIKYCSEVPEQENKMLAAGWRELPQVSEQVTGEAPELQPELQEVA